MAARKRVEAMWFEEVRLPEPGQSGRRDASRHFPFASLISTCLAFGVLTTTAPGLAQQTEPDPFAGIEEMVVVGGGNAAALLTPESTSAIAFDAKALTAFGVEDVGDIAAFVPNLEISTSNATNASFFVRGVGLQDFGANASSAVPIIQDGVVRNPSATQLVGLFDLGGLQVLRGPQASGNYRNASAGAILIQTAKPETTHSGYAQVSLSQITSHDAVDAPRYEVEGAMTGPIYEDIISFRLSARYSHEEPFVENGCANRVPLSARVPAAYVNDPRAQLCESLLGANGFGNPIGLDGETLRLNQTSTVRPFLDELIGNVEDYGFRAQLRFEPPDTGLDLTVRGEISNLSRDSTAGAHLGSAGTLGTGDTLGYRDPEITLKEQRFIANGASLAEARQLLQRYLIRERGDSKPYSGRFDSPGKTLVETLTLSTTATKEFDEITFETNAGYIDYRKSEDRDTDLSPNQLFPSAGDDQAWEVYVDFDFTGDTLGNLPVSWKTGGYTLLENVEARLLQTLPTGSTRENKFDQEIYSFGAFLEGEYEILEALSFSAGTRYNWEQKRFEVQDKNVSGFLTSVTRSENQLTWDSFTGFAQLRYDFTEEIGAYIRYSRGFKAGHFNPSRADAAEIPGRGFADPEKIDSIEWGLNFALWGGRASGNGALFYYSYKDYQVFRLTSTLAGVFREIQNAQRARNLGAELEFTLMPLEGYVPEEIEGLSITFRGGWLDAEFIEFTNVDLRQVGGFQFEVTIDNSGNQLINAPQLKTSVTVTWPLVLDSLGTFTPQYDLSWTDDVPFDPNRGRGQVDLLSQSRFPPYLIGNRAYAIHNVRLSYEPPGGDSFRLSGWCRNVADQRFDNFSVDLSSFALLQLHYPGDPRTCGADIRFSW